MKTNFTHLKNKGAIFLFVLALGLTFTNCSNDDDITPVEYNFDKDFEVEDLPELEDEDPTFTEPSTGKVKNSAETQAIVADLGDGSGDISAETQADLNAVESFMDPAFEDDAQNLDEAGIEAILNTTEFTGDLAALETALENAPAEVVALLPEIEYSSDYTGRISIRERHKGGVVVNPTMDDVYSQTQTGPCYDAARKSYNEALVKPTTARDAQLATVSANYSRRLGEADARYEARQSALDAALNTYKEELKLTAVALIAAANDIASTDAALAEQIRLLALAFTVEASSDLSEWFNAASDLLVVIEVEEKETIEGIKTTKEAAVKAAFATIKAKLDAALKAALNKCHNQGSGN